MWDGRILWRGVENKCCSKQVAEQHFSTNKDKRVGKEVTHHHPAQTAWFPAKVEVLGKLIV